MIYLSIILIFISIILEGIIPNIFRDIMPLFIISIIIISSTFKIESKNYYISIFILGVIYDMFYTSTIFLNGFIFLFIAYISKSLVNNQTNFIKAIFYYYILSFLYIIIMFYFTYFYVPKSMIELLIIYKNSIIINTTYFILFYFMFVGIKNINSNRNRKKTYF